jgi:hypothetical protein
MVESGFCVPECSIDVYDDGLSSRERCMWIGRWKEVRTTERVVCEVGQARDVEMA